MQINPSNNTVTYKISDLNLVKEAIKSIEHTLMELKPGKPAHNSILIDLKDIRQHLSIAK